MQTRRAKPQHENQTSDQYRNTVVGREYYFYFTQQYTRASVFIKDIHGVREVFAEITVYIYVRAMLNLSITRSLCLIIYLRWEVC